MKDNVLNKLHVLRGSQLPHAKLNEHDVSLIRQLITERQQAVDLARSLSNKRIAKKFGVSQRTIERISNGETWGHV